MIKRIISALGLVCILFSSAMATSRPLSGPFAPLGITEKQKTRLDKLGMKDKDFNVLLDLVESKRLTQTNLFNEFISPVLDEGYKWQAKLADLQKNHPVKKVEKKEEKKVAKKGVGEEKKKAVKERDQRRQQAEEKKKEQTEKKKKAREEAEHKAQEKARLEREKKEREERERKEGEEEKITEETEYFCRICNDKKVEAENGLCSSCEKWICPQCNTKNAASETVCFKCHTKQPDKEKKESKLEPKAPKLSNKCVGCGGMFEIQANNLCPDCKAKGWTCSVCTLINAAANAKCVACGAERGTDITPVVTPEAIAAKKTAEEKEKKAREEAEQKRKLEEQQKARDEEKKESKETVATDITPATTPGAILAKEEKKESKEATASTAIEKLIKYHEDSLGWDMNNLTNWQKAALEAFDSVLKKPASYSEKIKKASVKGGFIGYALHVALLNFPATFLVRNLWSEDLKQNDVKEDELKNFKKTQTILDLLMGIRTDDEVDKIFVKTNNLIIIYKDGNESKSTAISLAEMRHQKAEANEKEAWAFIVKKITDASK